MKISGGRNPVEIANGRANETTKWYFPDDNDGLIKVEVDIQRDVQNVYTLGTASLYKVTFYFVMKWK